MQALVETVRVLCALPRVERGRISVGPSPLVTALRAEAMSRSSRRPSERTRLKAIIARVDARMPGGGNCYRRALLEIALDRGAAAEPLFLGLNASGEPSSGHAWLGSAPNAGGAPKDYDAILAI
jgi:hypothetical protein